MSAFGPDMPLVADLAPGVRRLLAPNPSMMTGPGTNTYLFGQGQVAVLDPGPMMESHIERIQEIADAPISFVMVTHTHPDHSPAAVELARTTGAELLGRPPPDGQHQDMTFAPDRILEDGDRISIDGVEVEVIHTPVTRRIMCAICTQSSTGYSQVITSLTDRLWLSIHPMAT